MRRRIATLACAVGLTATTGTATAEFRDPLATPAMRTLRLTNSPMTAVVNAGGGRLVAAGWRGLVAVSEDAGRTWQQGEVPVREDLTALAFPSPMHGWAVGNEGLLLETTDGGHTWVKRLDGKLAARLMVDKYTRLAELNPADAKLAAAQREAQDYMAQAPARPFLDIAFQDERVGYIVGTFNLIFRTIDGGKSWEPLNEKTDNPKGYNLYCVRIAGDEVYLVGELGLALRLDRASDRFVRLAVPYEGTLFGLSATPATVIAAGLRGNAYLGDATGKRWRKIDFGPKTPATFGATATTEDGTIVLVTLAGEIFAGEAGDARFARVAAKEPMPYAAVAALGRDQVVVVGLRGIRLETIHQHP